MPIETADDPNAAGAKGSAPQQETSEDKLDTLLRNFGTTVGAGWEDQAILKIGPPAIHKLLVALTHADRFARYRIIKILDEMGSSAVPNLIKETKDANPSVRATAVSSFAGLIAAEKLRPEDEKIIVPALVERLNDPDHDVQVFASQVLGQLKQTKH